MNNNENMRFVITCPAVLHDKILTIKAIRSLTDMGLKEAKDASEVVGKKQTLYISQRLFTTHQNDAYKFIEEQFRILRNQGVDVGDPVFQLLDNLRDLASQALKQGEDELANEILQLVLAEKLRRNTIGLIED